MMKSRKFRVAAALVLSLALVAPLAFGSGLTTAAKKPKLSSSKISLKVGASKTLKIKNYKKKVKWKSSKSAVAKLSAIKKTSVKITGKKKGSAKVTATFKLSGKNKKLTCKVSVTAPAAAPVDTQPAVQQTTTPVKPVQVATPSPTPDFYDTYEGDDCLWKQPGAKIKDVFADYFMCGVATDPGSLMFGERAGLTRYHFNSVTMGNATKMESVVTDDVPNEKEYPELYAKYPEGYSKANVDNYYATNGEGRVIIDCTTIEKICKYCKEHDIKLRYHCFVWHSQVREYFFLQDYNWSDYDLDDYEANGWPTENYHKLADKETMVKRLNDYISQVIEYIYSHGYGDVVYAYDVINEANNGGGNRITYYVNENATDPSQVATTSGSGQSFGTNGGTRTSGGKTVTTNSSREDVESMMNTNGRVPGNDSYWYCTMGVDYLYLCFLDAYNAIQENFEKYKDQYGYKNKPSLIYNDYNNASAQHVVMAKYINKACNLANGTEGIQYCTGIGVQSHGVTADSTIKTIVDAGLECQITELDLSQDGDQQASTLKSLYKLYMKYSKNGEYGKNQGADYKGVTSVTQWGIADGESGWGGEHLHYMFEQILDDEEVFALEDAGTPVLFNLKPKAAYYGVLQAGGVDCGPKVY